MKISIIVLMLLAANGLRAQSGPSDREFKATPQNWANESLDLKPELKPNEIAGSRPDITYSGILVQVVKTDNPWELINPFAPASYGSGEDNLDRDIITKKETGLKFFSIKF